MMGYPGEGARAYTGKAYTRKDKKWNFKEKW